MTPPPAAPSASAPVTRADVPPLPRARRATVRHALRVRAAAAAFALLLAGGTLVPAAPAGAQSPPCGGAGCDDGNPCTDDICDPEAGCLHAHNNLPCSDGNACTTNDACVAGTCVGGNPAAGCTACQAVATIAPDGGILAGATGGASTLAGTCGSTTTSPERVFRWVPAVSGSATLQTCGTGTGFDTVLYVRSASCTGPQLACNDDAPCAIGGSTLNLGSRITLTVTAGQAYYIVVDGYSGRSGPFTLSVAPPSVCGNGVREGAEECDGAAASACASGQCTTACTCLAPAAGLPDMIPAISHVSVQLNTSVDPGDVIEGCAETTSGVDLIRFSVTSRNAGTADFHLGDPRCPTPCTQHPLAVCGNPEFICSPAAGHNHAHYNNFARYELLDPSNQAVVVGHKQGFCLLDSVCTRPTYTCDDQGISAGCADVYEAGLGCQYLDITGVPGGTYTLRVTLDPFDRIAELAEGNNSVSVPVTIPGPAVTPCDQATPIPAAGGTVTGATSGMSSLAGSCGSTGSAPERVFRWTPAVSGTATVSTCSATATTYDTALYMRSGSCIGAEVSCNDDTSGCATTRNGGQGSRLAPAVVAGQTYYIVVDGYGGQSGSFSLTVTPPGGGGGGPDPCANPVIVPAAGATVLGTIAGNGSLTGSCGSAASSGESVLLWTPAVSGTATIDTCGASTTFDTVLYVRSGACGTGTQIACSNDACATSNSTTQGSRLSVDVSAGQPYFIFVDGNAGATGAFGLTVTPPASGAGSGSCASPVPIPAGGGTVTGTTAGTSVLAGTCGNTTGSPEQVFSWTPARSGTATIETCGSGTAFDTVLYARAGTCAGAPLACSDDVCTIAGGALRGSRIRPTVTAGQTYLIVVDGYGGASGAFNLRVTSP
jgi:hypothetical protein